MHRSWPNWCICWFPLMIEFYCSWSLESLTKQAVRCLGSMRSRSNWDSLSLRMALKLKFLSETTTVLNAWLLLTGWWKSSCSESLTQVIVKLTMIQFDRRESLRRFAWITIFTSILFEMFLCHEIRMIVAVWLTYFVYFRDDECFNCC